jgi:D-alanyl-D-alanine carboxypeptidase (penicillin-binding protein 5/6)
MPRKSEGMLAWLPLARLLLACVFLLAGSCGATPGAEKVTEENPFPTVSKAYRVVINGKLIWQKNSENRLPPASLTKLMTVLIASERLNPDAAVTVGSEAARETGKRIGLRNGDTLSVAHLLAASLIASANDACHALADAVAQDQSRFVVLMNQRAASMGLKNTHFTNACGHDAPQHYASAQDLQVLAQAVMKNPDLARLATQPQMSITTINSTPNSARNFSLQSTNALLGRYPGVVGIKTGTTSLAGTCFVVLARRGTIEVLVVMLNSKDRWWDAVDLLDLAFARAETPR